ncbi:hypothetical protein LOK49_LG05G02720 [Camellia lanceoleosa]|uniref:Uncharacterized protein n=1 Tax=Camellia lanceoleosa TaxID=1840588 RepID=A0ACC0HVJ4_9ERIC|nr:hypothetical protein LOK49_LG05G02720 [Camellia lanceoleosa]
MVPVLNEVSASMKDKIQVVKIDPEKYISVADKQCNAWPPTYVDHTLQEISAVNCNCANLSSDHDFYRYEAIKRLTDFVDDAKTEYLTFVDLAKESVLAADLAMLHHLGLDAHCNRIGKRVSTGCGPSNAIPSGLGFALQLASKFFFVFS